MCHDLKTRLEPPEESFGYVPARLGVVGACHAKRLPFERCSFSLYADTGREALLIEARLVAHHVFEGSCSLSLAGIVQDMGDASSKSLQLGQLQGSALMLRHARHRAGSPNAFRCTFKRVRRSCFGGIQPKVESRRLKHDQVNTHLKDYRGSPTRLHSGRSWKRVLRAGAVAAQRKLKISAGVLSGAST